jgi:pimeloyl-ACP methyl ester carboxylesterase
LTQKPLALLIPGLDGSGRLYGPHLAALSVRFRPLAWRFKPRDCFDFADLVSELGDATAGEEPGSIAVAGESFGGPIAMHFVLSFPDRVRSLVLVNTFCFYSGRIRIALACRLAPMLRWQVPRRAKNMVGAGLLASEGVPAAGRRLYREVVDGVYLPAYLQRLALTRRVDLRPRLSEIRIPTRILAGGRDKVVPSLRQARLMARSIHGARLHTFARAGHALLLTPGFSLADYL